MSNGTPKIKIKIYTKKTHFPIFAKKFRKPWMKLNFFCQFPNPWALGLAGMGCYTSKCEKIQNHCTLLDTGTLYAIIKYILRMFLIII
jgi:hypothetical protein